MGFFSKLFGKSDVQGCTKSQAHPPLDLAQLLRDITKHVSLVLGEEITQAERIAALIKFGPDVIREIEATIQYVAAHGESDSEFENAGLLCEAIGKIGGKEAIDVLKRFTTTESNIYEYRHIRSGAEKGLSYLDNSQLDAKTQGEKSKRDGEQGKATTRESIPGLLDIAYKQAERGECIPAVHTFLQAVEIEPRFMMSSRAWLNIASVVTGDVPPGRTKNWIKLPKELVPDRVVAQLSRLPNDSLLPGYPGPFLEPPTETEIRRLIADLREILRRYADPMTISVSTHDGASDIPTAAEQEQNKAYAAVAGKEQATDERRHEIQRGGFGEPYCSEICYDQAGRAMSTARLTGADGACKYCKSVVGPRHVTLVKREGLVFICQSCRDRVQPEIQALSRCYMCEAPLA